MNYPWGNKPVVREWSAKMILIRLLLYPVSIFLILLGIYLWHDLTERTFRNFSIIAGTIGFPLAYLYLDIKVQVVNARKRKAFRKKYPTGEY